MFSDFKDSFPQVTIFSLEQLPIRVLDLSIPSEKSRHDRMVELAGQMLGYKKRLAEARTDKDKDYYTNRCDGIDRQIDALVYELYGLTPSEIQIVEGAVK